MSQSRLNSLALLSIEEEILNSIELTSPALLASLLAWKPVESTCSVSCDFSEYVY